MISLAEGFTDIFQEYVPKLSLLKYFLVWFRQLEHIYVSLG